MQTQTIVPKPVQHKVVPLRAKRRVAASPAPVVDFSCATRRYPEAIFGNLPVGFTLEDQPIWALNAWHRKAMKAVNDLPKGYTDDDLSGAMAIANEIFEAIKGKTERRARDVSVQMNAIVERFAFMGARSIEEELSIDDFKSMATTLAAATAPIMPTKEMGALSRGPKLTRSGQLFRYQSFLIQELMTLSCALYGHPRYALDYVFFDHEVTKRCSPNFRNGKPYSRKGRAKHPFFDEIQLPTRARTVLKSLKINSDDAGDLADLRRKKPSRRAGRER